MPSSLRFITSGVPATGAPYAARMGQGGSELELALEDAGGVDAGREFSARLRTLLDAELERGVSELDEARTGYETPIVVAVAPRDDALLAALPVVKELRADTGAVGDARRRSAPSRWWSRWWRELRRGRRARPRTCASGLGAAATLLLLLPAAGSPSRPPIRGGVSTPVREPLHRSPEGAGRARAPDTCSGAPTTCGPDRHHAPASGGRGRYAAGRRRPSTRMRSMFSRPSFSYSSGWLGHARARGSRPVAAHHAPHSSASTAWKLAATTPRSTPGRGLCRQRTGARDEVGGRRWGRGTVAEKPSVASAMSVSTQEEQRDPPSQLTRASSAG